MTERTLAAAVAARPYPQFNHWWRIGANFTRCMAPAISESWQALPGNSGDLAAVHACVEEYMNLVYRRPLRPDLVEAFAAGAVEPLWSGEFDALSYGFYRTAFELADAQAGAGTPAAQATRYAFTQVVGRRFFDALLSQVALELPASLATQEEFAMLRRALHRLGRFLLEEGYLRTHFAFRFDVARRPDGQPIHQTADQVVERLRRDGVAYALYEMGYPALLPSAVYLFNTLGAAQHHSSRTIEELFDRIGYAAAEAPDFDPTNYGPELVLELWEIRRRA
ncbi:MAG TPA: hypothetical protein VNK95_23425 [Caldilineaceae bacterium]|nr:hypothetical protein [Caldilineaceae bacterium]